MGAFYCCVVHWLGRIVKEDIHISGTISLEKRTDGIFLWKYYL